MQPERNTRGLGQGLLERPLTARSVVASLLLGMRPPRLSGARLVRWCGLFGISEGTARVALSRMVGSGELRAAAGVYELQGRVRARQPAQDWSLDPDLADAGGSWRMAIVDGAARPAAERAALRDAMRRLRMGEAREGVWARPANLPRAAAPADAWDVVEAQCAWWTGEPDEDPRALAERLFAPRAWAERARELVDRLGAVTGAIGAGDDESLADAFTVGAASLAHVRVDPLLPTELCGPGWPGRALRDGYREYQRVFGTAVREWFRAS
jgi:phenylacetic acid degradation operon negative regulatory protein